MIGAILYLCVFYFTRTTRELFTLTLKQWQLNVCLKGELISDLVSAVDLRWNLSTDIVKFFMFYVKFPL